MRLCNHVPHNPTVDDVTVCELCGARIAADSEGLYQTYIIPPGGKSITCLRCLLTSYHPDDVRYFYCGYCSQFHEIIS